MEIDQPSQEKPDQEAPDEQETSRILRSYECAFCKRGFSNAQALGGHMNIHRKDKAKFKNSISSYETHLKSSEIPKNNIASSFSALPLEANFREDRSPMIKWPWILDVDGHKTDVGVHQLLFFTDKPSNKSQEKGGIEAPEIIDKGFSSSSHDCSSMELDLELRLGPDPDQGTSPKTSTKKFF